MVGKMMGKMIDRLSEVAVASCVMNACQESAKMMLWEQQRSLLRHMDFLAHIPHVDLRYQMLPTSCRAHINQERKRCILYKGNRSRPVVHPGGTLCVLIEPMTYVQSGKASECI
jgi:hypothetical protein